MKRSREARYAGIFTLVMLTMSLAMTCPAQAINSWLNTRNRAVFQLEIEKPSFDKSYGYSLLSGRERSAFAVFASAHIRLSQNTRLVLEMPWARVSWKYEGNGNGLLITSGSDSEIGNPYVGVCWSRPGSSTVLELGLRLPLMGDDLRIVSSYAIYSSIDRFEAFIPKITTGRLAVGYRYESSDDVIVKLQAGPTVMHPDEGDAEVFLDYRFETWFDSRKFFLGGCFSGRFLLTDEDDINERTTGQIMLAGGPVFGAIRPGANLIFPLDDSISRYVDIVYGVNFSYFFPQK